jgi:glycosyltransferase involved in cell wall biosynthesis
VDAAEPDLTLVLACYNEEGHIRESVREIVDVLEHTSWSYEIIFVDDCSRDRTRELITEIVAEYPGVAMSHLFHRVNLGRGASVSDGFRRGRGRHRGYIDIDLEVGAHYIPVCVRALENGADIATALRIYKFEWRSLDRYLLTRGYAWLVRRLLHTRLRDTETGFKFFTASRSGWLLDEIADTGWFWDTEFMIRAERSGLSIREVPCLFLRRREKSSSVRVVADSLDYLRKLMRFRRIARALQPRSGR